MTPSTPSTVSYRLCPSPEPSIFFFEPEPTSPFSSQQTLSTDNSTLYVPFFSSDDFHHLKSSLKTPAVRFAHGQRCAPRVLTPPPQRILTAGRRPSYTISRLSIPRILSDGDDSSTNEMRLQIQLSRTALLLAKSVKQNAMLADADAFEVEVVDRYPLPPLLVKRPRPLWDWCLRKAVRKFRTLGRAITCTDIE